MHRYTDKIHFSTKEKAINHQLLRMDQMVFYAYNQ